MAYSNKFVRNVHSFSLAYLLIYLYVERINAFVITFHNSKSLSFELVEMIAFRIMLLLQVLVLYFIAVI